MGDVGLVEPLDPEVAVEVGGGLAQALVRVLLQGVLHVHGEQVPDRRRRQLGKNIERFKLVYRTGHYEWQFNRY